MTNEPRAGNGLDPEMLAAYIDKRLPPDERAAVEAKLAADPDSYELLVELIHADEALKGETPAEGEATQPADHEEPQSRAGAVVPMVPKPKRAGGWLIAGGVLAAAAALVVAVRLQPDLLQRVRGGDAVDPQLAKLVAAVGEERYIEARLTGGFKYGPVRPVTRGAGDSGQSLTLLAAAAALRESPDGVSDESRIHALAIAKLLLGNVAEAISDLETATARHPADARLLADLSAAYLTRGQLEGNEADFQTALALANRAVDVDEFLLEPRFNRALALELLRDRQAAQAWRDYALRDQSEWGREASQHLSDSSQPK